MRIEQLTDKDETWLRRWLMSFDPTFAVHRQLKDYFLQDTPDFGAVRVRYITSTDEFTSAVAFFSRYNGKAFIHLYTGSSMELDHVVEWLGNLPTQIYFKSHQRDPGSNWQHVLAVTPGYVVDHPAYEGVFSRVAPRFPGNVYETTEEYFHARRPDSGTASQ